MATMNLAPILKHQFSDSNGNPLVGGKLFSYQAGTTTPQATYTDISGVTPNANPVVLDSAGECSLWLDPSLSYKFIMQDVNSSIQWTVDNIVGLLTVNSVPTLSIQDRAVTTIKMALLAVDSTILASDASVDANRAVTTNSIKDGAITTAKLASGSVIQSKLSLVAPTVQKFTTGSGNYNKNYAFQIVNGNATAGATYTNNGITYTVYATVTAANLVYMSGNGAPLASGTLTKATGSGDATIAFSSVAAPLYIGVEMVGGGGGGAGASLGSAGVDTTFGTSLLVAGGAGVGLGFNGGAGGTFSLGVGPIDIGSANGTNGAGGSSGQSGVGLFAGVVGASSAFGGGGGSGGAGNNAGGNAAANTGSGGGGGGEINAGFNQTGGSASGGLVRALITNPASTYPYVIGTGGSGGSGNANYAAGGNGAAGIIIVKEFYQ